MAHVAFYKFKVVAEHVEQVFLQTHHQGMYPAVEDGVCPLPAHLGGMARWHVLHMQGGGDHGAGNTQAFGTVAFHLGAKHQLRGGGRHRLLHLQVVVCN